MEILNVLENSGQVMPEHSAAAAITVQALSGLAGVGQPQAYEGAPGG